MTLASAARALIPVDVRAFARRRAPSASQLLFAFGGEPDESSARKQRWLCLGLCAGLFLEWVKQALRGVVGFTPAVICVAAALCLAARRVRAGSALSLAVATWGVWFTLPLTPNHGFALLLALAWCCASAFGKGELGPEAALRWLGFTILFWAGAQKVLYDSYWNGSFLGAKLASGEPRFYWLGLVAGTEELDRLRRALPDGPFSFQSWPVLWLSRAIPVLEIGLSLALTLKTWRTSAAAASLLFVMLAQLAAGEMTFAITAGALLSAYFEEQLAARLVKVVWIATLGLTAWAFLLPGSIVN
jgi:hypothetical protein